MQKPSFKIPLVVAALAAGAAGLVGSTSGAGAAIQSPQARTPSAPDTSATAPGGATVVRDVVLAVHGGAGAVPRGSLTPEQEKAYRDGLARALRAGNDKLKAGRSSIEAVKAAVQVLEDDPNFNAGEGAVFNADGEQELDASIMNGKDLKSGAVAGVHNTKNPILLADMVKDHSPHVLLSGRGPTSSRCATACPTRPRTTSSPSAGGTA